MSSKSFRTLLKKIVVAAFSSLISLAMVEVTLRSFFPIYQTANASAFEFDPELGTRLKANIHLINVTDFQDEMRTNRFGTANFQESWDQYRNLIVASGDSYTQGTGLPADLSYPSQLDLTLNQDGTGEYAANFGVVNLGVPGYGGEQSLIALKRWWLAAERKPRFILYLGCDNDFDDDLLFKSGYRHRHIIDGNPAWGPFVRPLQWITNDLQIGIRIKMIVGNFRRRSLGAAGQNSEKFASEPSPAESEKAVFEDLVRFAEEGGSTLIISWSDNSGSYDWVKGWAERRNVAFADWRTPTLAVKQLVPELPLENNHSGGHHRGWVNRLIADAFARKIREHDQ